VAVAAVEAMLDIQLLFLPRRVVILPLPSVRTSKKRHALLSSPHKTLSFSVMNVHVLEPRPKKK
jgi:hypothetical protein